MFHCLGDSHSLVFLGEDRRPLHKTFFPMTWYQNKNYLFRCINIGPYLAYNFQDKAKIIEPLLKDAHLNDRIVFSFGEIDCRAHLIRQAKSQCRNIKDIVSECVENYVKGLEALASRSPLFSASLPIVLFVAPPHKSFDKQGTLPSYGTYVQRRLTSNLFNECLEKACKKRNFYFLSIYDALVLPNATRSEMFLDEVHVLPSKCFPLLLNILKRDGLYG